MIIRQCLQRYDGTAPNTVGDASKSIISNQSMNGSPLVERPGPKLGIYSSMTLRMKDGLPKERQASVNDELLAPNSDMPNISRCLIVDDNSVNRRLLSVFMKKRKISFKEAINGLEALEMYREAVTPFDTILMDISM